MTVGVYPGSFDPFTVGHLDVLTSAAGLFDLVYVAVLHNVDKRPIFTVKERMDMIRNVLAVEKLDNAMRGYGVPQISFCLESHVDDIARTLNMDPYKIRELNKMEVGYVDGFYKYVNYVDSIGQIMEKGAKWR